MSIPQGLRARTALTLAVVAVALAWGGWPVLRAQGPYDASLYSGLRWRMLGPFRGGRVDAVSGVPGRPNEFYFGAVNGGVWKTDRRRPRLDAGVRLAAGRVDRRARRRAVGARHRLRRQRRVHAARFDGLRQRHVQVDRRRQDVDAHRPRQHAAHRQGRGRSEESEHRRSSRRSAISTTANPDRGVFRSQRRRQDVEEGALQERQRRRRRRRDRSDELAGGLRRALEHAAADLVHLSADATDRAAASSSRPTAARRGSS